MSIVDVLPTVMAALGEPLSPEFDGDARTDVLADVGADDPTVMHPEDVPAPLTRSDVDDDQDERDAVVEERLADLGYIE
jgi:hypothetical protein